MNHGERGELRDCSEHLIGATLAAAISVHRELGPRLLESVYENAFMVELADSGIAAKR